MDVQALAGRQLAAYNHGDLDAFCACYHPEVQVYEGERRTVQGIAAFRDRYRALFERGGFGAVVPQRLAQGPHCVDLEHWWRDDPETGERRQGSLLVRYTERDGLIAVVQFLVGG